MLDTRSDHPPLVGSKLAYLDSALVCAARSMHIAVVLHTVPVLKQGCTLQFSLSYQTTVCIMMRRPKSQQGGQPLGGETNEHALVLQQASEAVASMQHAAVTQMEWETDVVWGTQQQPTVTEPSLEEDEDNGPEGAGVAISLCIYRGPSPGPWLPASASRESME